MKFRDYIYIISMIFFVILAYLLFDRGFNVKTKIVVDYQKYSDVTYKVYLLDNTDFDSRYQKMNERYVSSLVDKINYDFMYNKIFNKDVSGYYSYEVVGVLHAYLDDITEDVWTKEYKLIDNNTSVINQNNVRNIEINDRVIIDYQKYRDDLDKFSKKYDLKLNGYLEINYLIKENLNFKGIDKIISDESIITSIIPLSYDTFKINIRNDNNTINNYYDFSTKGNVNYLFLVLAAFSLSIAISFLALVIRKMVIISNSKTKYVKELKKILSTYDDKIVKIKGFYNKKKYNLIYVDSFWELLDVYNKIGNPISYREVKKGEEAIFLIVDDDNAWVYCLNNKKNVN